MDSLARWHDAERLLKSGAADQARTQYAALTADPVLAAQAHLRLSLMASDQRQLREATEHALAAFAARNDDPDLLALIAKRLNTLGETEAARACALDEAILSRADAQTSAEMGHLLSNATLHADALVLLDRARDQGLRAPQLDYLRGLCLLYAGRLEEAEAAFESCLAEQPDHAQALRGLTRLRRRPAEEDGRVDRLRAAIAVAKPIDKPVLNYALFAELDARDDIDGAWQALETGMRLRRNQLRYDPAADAALFDHLMALRGDAPAAPMPDGPTPIFIVGLPRTGTTLLERILGSHADVADAGELPDAARQLRWCANLPGAAVLDVELARAVSQADLSDFGARYLDHARWRAHGRRVFTDKTPHNFLSLAYLARALPNARFLHMVRGPLDTCFSNLKEWFAGAYPHSYDQQEMADHYRRYRVLMAHWRTQFPDRILDVHYRDLVTDPTRVAREVLQFCGLSPDSSVVDIAGRGGTVSTASAVQVREPVHARFLEQWRRYETQLAPLRERLGSYAYSARS